MASPPTDTTTTENDTKPKVKSEADSEPFYDGRSYQDGSVSGRVEKEGDNRYERDGKEGRVGQISQSDEEGVEVVLNDRGSTNVVDQSPKSRPASDQNVFRVPHAVRPRPARPPGPGGPPPQHVEGSGSFSYQGDYPPPRPYPVPQYNPSGSFDEGSYHRQSHYSPHVQYPHPGARYSSEDVNVISPNQKGDPKYGPPGNPRSRHPHQHPPPHPHGHPPHSHSHSHSHSHPHSRSHSRSHYYQYPPTSPVSRPGAVHSSSPLRLRSYPVRRGDGPYSKAQRGEQHPDDGTWNPLPAPARTGSSSEQPRPPLVTESSFDSDHYSGSHYSHPSHPPTPGSHLPPHHDPHHHFYNGGGSWGSFDSSAPPPQHYDDYRHQGYHPPESPYSPYSTYPPYSSSGYYSEPYSPYHQGYGPAAHSYDEDERGLLKDYHPDRDGEESANAVTPTDPKKRTGSSAANAADKSGIVLPKAAQEVDFEVTDPPMEPVTPPSTDPICESLADVNSYDVLCGRGGGTNSQIGNKRFRKLVQEFQPTYLLARRKEKPLLARTIVLIIRKRGGHFLRKDDDTGMLYEVGDAKAEAKTSQALREGLDVRATKSAANNLVNKKKKKKGKVTKTEETPTPTPTPTPTTPARTSEANTSISTDASANASASTNASTSTSISNSSNTEPAPETPPPKSQTTDIKSTHSPPTLPRLQDEEVKAGMVHPHSPEAMQFRKRRRMRTDGCTADKFFPDFCPPRADLARSASPTHDDDVLDFSGTPQRRNIHEGGMGPVHGHHGPGPMPHHHYDTEHIPAPGCADIALAMMTGEPGGNFCMTRTKWK